MDSESTFSLYGWLQHKIMHFIAIIIPNNQYQSRIHNTVFIIHLISHEIKFGI